MIAPVVGEKNYPLRVPTELFDRIRALAVDRERSANWVMVRLLKHAASQKADWIDEALR